jgi:hypothetical protein
MDPSGWVSYHFIPVGKRDRRKKKDGAEVPRDVSRLVWREHESAIKARMDENSRQRCKKLNKGGEGGAFPGTAFLERGNGVLGIA